MKKFNPLLSIVCGCLLLLNMQSCSTKQGMVSCPDLHRANHHQMASRITHHQADHTAVVQQNANQQAQNPEAATANTSGQKASPGTIAPVGTASISNDVPVIKHPKDIFKILTEDERQQVRSELSTMFGKKAFLKNIALKRFDKLDKKIPAPTESILSRGGGGGLSTGEILSIVAIACAITWVLGIAGLIIGIIALIKINHEGGANWAKILAIIAIVLGAIDLLTFIIWLALVAFVASTVGVI